jgi:hypothetical protein
MGMNVYALGFGTQTAQWKKSVRKYKELEYEGKDIPNELENFLGCDDPDETGPPMELGKCKSDWSDESTWGIEIDVSKIPEGVKTIRFVVSP